MEYLYSPFFFLLVGMVISEWRVEDPRKKAMQCFEEIVNDGEISNLLIDITTPDKIDEFCRRHAELQKCARENEHHLSIEENTEFLQKISGVHSFYLNICPPGTDITTDYKGNSPCFKLIRNKILSCGSDLPDLNSYKMKTSLRSRCCALRTHNDCLRKVTEESCGTEAAVVVEKILSRYFERKLKECNASSYSCNDKGYTSGPDSTESHKRKSPSTNWNLPTTRDYWYRTTDRKYSKDTTDADKNVNWKRATEADIWKKYHHTSNNAVKTSSALGLISCFLAILFFKL